MPALGDDSDTEDGGPVATYQSYIAEGDILSKQGEFRKSIEAYSKVFSLRLLYKAI